MPMYLADAAKKLPAESARTATPTHRAAPLVNARCLPLASWQKLAMRSYLKASSLVVVGPPIEVSTHALASCGSAYLKASTLLADPYNMEHIKIEKV